MKNSKLAIAVLLTTLTSATIIPAVYAEDEQTVTNSVSPTGTETTTITDQPVDVPATTSPTGSDN